MVQSLVSYAPAMYMAMQNNHGHHGHADPMVVLAMYIVLTLITLPAGILFIFKYKCDLADSPNAYIGVGGAAFVTIQVIAVIVLLMLGVYQLIH